MTEAAPIFGRPTGLRFYEVLRICTIALVFAGLLDPSDLLFHLKIPAFAAILIVWISRRGYTSTHLSPMTWITTLSFAFLIPLLWTLIGMLHANVHTAEYPFALLKTLLFILLVPVLIGADIDLASLIIRMGIIVVIATLALVILFLTSKRLLVLIIPRLKDLNEVMITPSRDLFGLGLGTFYYKTCALLMLPFSYCFNVALQRTVRRKLAVLLALLFAAVLLASGARANVIAMLCVAAILSVRAMHKSFGRIAALSVAVVCFGLVAAVSIPQITNVREASYAEKLRIYQSYNREFDINPSALLWGEGAGSEFYTEDGHGWTSSTELSYLELLRVFGMPMTIMVIACLLWLDYRLFVTGAQALAWGFLGYLAICASNPLLLSSTGLLAVCAMWKQSIRPSRNTSMFNLPGLYS
jgi:hypothetical protein